MLSEPLGASPRLPCAVSSASDLAGFGRRRVGSAGNSRGTLEFRDHHCPASLLAPFPASSLTVVFGQGLGFAWYLGRGKPGRGAPGTAGFKAPPECLGAQIAKLLS